MNYISALPMDQGRSREPEDESALVRAAQASPVAFGQLHLRYETRIYRYLRTRTATDDDAADLTQQVFLQALDALPKYRERGSPFAAWLFRIARNVSTDYHRRRRSTVTWDLLPEALHPTSGQSPEAAVLERETMERLRELLAGLDPERRELVTLRFVARLTVPEIAETIGKSESTVQRQIRGILRGFKEAFDGTR